ncbi:MAG: Hsp20 family protein [Alphaproteobacteria bacterium]|nr:Hsp20 family protein [Alphaproteobacteria bacterium]
MRFDLSPLYRSTVGFDRLFQMLDANTTDAQSYPPYNIERLGETDYRITMAVAGFAESDLAIEVKENALTVSGKRTEDEKRSYLHQGIAARAFERRFQLADHVEVSGAKLEHGLLHIELKRVIPDAKKPRRIEIAAAAKPAQTIEAQAA